MPEKGQGRDPDGSDASFEGPDLSLDPENERASENIARHRSLWKGFWSGLDRRGGRIQALAAAGAIVAFAITILSRTIFAGTDVESVDLLELADAQFGQDSVEVVHQSLPPGFTEGMQILPREVAPIELYFRNNTNNTVILTSLAVEVHQVVSLPYCYGEDGGTLVASWEYEFQFPPFWVGDSWRGSDTRNFQIKPRSADGLAVTLGPSESAPFADQLWLFSVSGQFASEGEQTFVDGIGTDRQLGAGVTVSDEAEYALSEINRIGQQARSKFCAESTLANIDGLESSLRRLEGELQISHPELDKAIEYYEILLASLG